MHLYANAGGLSCSHTHHAFLYRNISFLARFTKCDHQTSFGFIYINQDLCTTSCSCDTDIPVINQAHTPLDCLSRLDKSVPRLEEEEERGGRKCNFEDTVLCMPRQHFSLFLLPLGSSYNILCPKTSEHFTDIT